MSMVPRISVTDVTDATFERDVIQRSNEVPVVVDLWAAWCGPCRTLGPTLEKVVGETDGRVELAKVDVDRNPMVAGSFQVKSIPAVYALRDGKVVDSFIGALPETAIREFVNRLAPAETEADRLVARGDEHALRQAIELDPHHSGAVIALAELLAQRGDGEEALALLTRIPETPDARRVAALARMGAEAASGDDVEARLDRLLDRVKDDESARREFLDVLELLGNDDPRTASYRRALATRLF